MNLKIKFISVVSLAVMPLLLGCGKKQADLIEVLFSPKDTYIVPGKTYSCVGVHSDPPDLEGPFTKFGMVLNNISDKDLRLFFIKVTGTGSGLTSDFSVSITPDGSEAFTLLKKAGTTASGNSSSLLDTKKLFPGYPPPYDANRVGLDGCLEPFTGFEFGNKKMPSTVVFNWKFYFSIVDGSANEEPYDFTATTTSKYRGE